MTPDSPSTAPAPVADWYVYTYNGGCYTVDTLDGRPHRSGPATARDIAQATLRGKFRG